jgi:hypothetical protein
MQMLSPPLCSPLASTLVRGPPGFGPFTLNKLWCQPMLTKFFTTLLVWSTSWCGEKHTLMCPSGYVVLF